MAHVRTPVYAELPTEAEVGDTAALKGEVGPPDEYYVWAGPKGWHRSVAAVQDRFFHTNNREERG